MAIRRLRFAHDNPFANLKDYGDDLGSGEQALIEDKTFTSQASYNHMDEKHEELEAPRYLYIPSVITSIGLSGRTIVEYLCPVPIPDEACDPLPVRDDNLTWSMVDGAEGREGADDGRASARGLEKALNAI